MFGDRFEGYAAQITYGCDKQRLLENTSEPDFVVTMFWAPEGILSPERVKWTPKSRQQFKLCGSVKG